MNPKPIVAMVLTIILIFAGFYVFSNKLDLNIFNSKTIDKKVSELRRNIPMQAEFSIMQPLSISFDTSSIPQNIELEFIPNSTIKINNQNIKSRSETMNLSIINYSGKVSILNGNIMLSGTGKDIEIGNFEFPGKGSVELNGRIKDFSIKEIQGSYQFTRTTGRFEVVTNQSKQSFTTMNDDIEIRNYLGSFEIVLSDNETIKMNGAVSKLIFPEFTISKDY